MSSRGPLTYGLTHLSIAVHDIQRTLHFYTEVFDMQVMYHEENLLQLTTPGAHDILVFEKREPELIGVAGGIAHFGFRLKDPADIDEMIQRATRAGATIIDTGEFVRNSPFVFFKDPDGYVVEVWYE